MRLDQWLFEQGFVDSREKARREILAGRVRDARSGEALDKPGQKVKSDLLVKLVEAPRFVGRGGEKLFSFLESSTLVVTGLRCLDVGSSTGGFADCLLQAGAKQILCVDVGTNQLHERIKSDERVEVFENQDIRSFPAQDHAPIDLVTVDCSFISLRKILPRLREQIPSAKWVLLFKPQFEVGRGVAMPRGVVKDRQRWESLQEMLLFLDSLGFNPTMVLESSVKGMKGNQESFILVDDQSMSERQHLFRAYDIRGRAETELDTSLMRRIGQVLSKKVLSSFPKKKRVVIGVGQDTRPSSPSLRESLFQGLDHPQVDLVSLGQTSTPMVYYASQEFQLDAAFQVTASHNPKEDNGLKMLIDHQALFGEEIRAIGLEALSMRETEAQFPSPTPNDRASDLKSAYLNFLSQEFNFRRKFRVALDCANGMAGLVAREAFASHCSELDILFEDVDCSFPNHPADPTVEKNLQALKGRMKEKPYDIGFAFDGDGDRLGVVTASGRTLWGDEILMFLSEKVLKENLGATIIGEVKCSQKLFSMIRDRGGQPVMYKTGHSLIKQKLKELKAPIAGEMSGHLFFGDRFFGFDDGIYAALRFLEVMDQLGLDPDEWISSFPQMEATPEIRIACSEDQKARLIASVTDYFKKSKDGELNLIDGVRVSFPDFSWLLARASNTEAVIVVRVEATSRSRRDELLKELETALGRPIHV